MTDKELEEVKRKEIEELLKYKADILLMNPPYDGDLHMKFLEKSLDFIKEDGHVIQVSPNIFIKSFIGTKIYNFAKLLNDKLENIEIFNHDESNSIFNLGHAINEIAIYVVSNNPVETVDINKLGTENEIERNIIIKLKSKREGKLNWENKNTKRHGEQTGYFCNLYTWHVGTNAYNTCINDSPKFTRTVYFDNETQLKNFKDSFKTKFMEYYTREIIWAGSGITDKCFMFNKEFYNNPVTDEVFFKFFNLTEEEIKYILDKVKTYE